MIGRSIAPVPQISFAPYDKPIPISVWLANMMHSARKPRFIVNWYGSDSDDSEDDGEVLGISISNRFFSLLHFQANKRIALKAQR